MDSNAGYRSSASSVAIRSLEWLHTPTRCPPSDNVRYDTHAVGPWESDGMVACTGTGDADCTLVGVACFSFADITGGNARPKTKRRWPRRPRGWSQRATDAPPVAQAPPPCTPPHAAVAGGPTRWGHRTSRHRWSVHRDNQPPCETGTTQTECIYDGEAHGDHKECRGQRHRMVCGRRVQRVRRKGGARRETAK